MVGADGDEHNLVHWNIPSACWLAYAFHSYSYLGLAVLAPISVGALEGHRGTGTPNRLPSCPYKHISC